MLKTIQNVWVSMQIVSSVYITVKSILNILILDSFDAWTRYNLVSLVMTNNTALRAGFSVTISSIVLGFIFSKTSGRPNFKFLPLIDGPSPKEFQKIFQPTNLGIAKWLTITIAIQSMLLNMLVILPFVFSQLIPALVIFIP